MKNLQEFFSVLNSAGVKYAILSDYRTIDSATTAEILIENRVYFEHAISMFLPADQYIYTVNPGTKDTFSVTVREKGRGICTESIESEILYQAAFRDGFQVKAPGTHTLLKFFLFRMVNFKSKPTEYETHVFREYLEDVAGKPMPCLYPDITGIDKLGNPVNGSKTVVVSSATQLESDTKDTTKSTSKLPFKFQGTS